MRYLEDQIGGDGIKSLMASLAGGASFDTAISTASGGSYANAAAFETELMDTGTIFEDFITSDINLGNADNGAFGGADASGGLSRTETIEGNVTGKTTNNFLTTFVSGDDDSANDFASNVNYAAAGFDEIRLENYGVDIGSESTQEKLFQVGSNANEVITMALGGFSAEVLGVDSIDLVNNAQAAIDAADAALNYVTSQRTGLGAFMNRVEHTIDNLSNIHENVSASRSRIQDTDYAIETANLTKNQIIQQAATALMAQSAQQPQFILQLLG